MIGGVDRRPAPRRALRLGAAALAVTACLASGCAARPDRFAAFRDAPAASPPDLRRGELTGRGGYASLGAHVRLRDDTPPLTPIVEAERAASLPPVYFVPPMPEGSYGPVGASGPVDPYGGVGFVGPYLAPVGGVWPGVRLPHDPPPSGPFARGYHASPDADVSHHRPGLSTGSGIYGRGGR